MRDLTAAESAELVAERDRVWPMFAAWFTSPDRDRYESEHPELAPAFCAFLDRLDAPNHPAPRLAAGGGR